MPREDTVLVLGAYGLVGREIVRHLLAKTRLNIVATGRDPQRLRTLAADTPAGRLRTEVLDAADQRRLLELAREAGLTINAVGPYALHGADIARLAIGAESAYIDFANEQAHYRRLERLDEPARRKGLLLLTAAGLIPGMSTLLLELSARRIGEPETLEAFFAGGRMPDAQSGLGSLLSGALEASLETWEVADGALRPFVVGGGGFKRAMPAPFGQAHFLPFPGIDVLLAAQRPCVRRAQTYMALVAPPPGFFAAMRVLRPHARPWAYAWVRRLVAVVAWMEHRAAVRRNLGTECVVLVRAARAGAAVELEITVPDGGIGAAYLPVLFAKRWAEGRIERPGLVTPLDLIDPEAAFDELAQLGWTLSVNVSEI